MTKLENYLYDGCRWQARAVMCYLQDRAELILDKTYTGNAWDLYDGKLLINRYDGCREQGYVFSLRYKGKQVNYAVFNHCISDAICVVVGHAFTDHSDGWDGKAWSKYEHDKEFDYDEIVKCGEWIEEDMKYHIEKWQEEEGRHKKDDEDE